VTLQAGESRAYEIRFNDGKGFGKLPAGEYEIRVTYYATSKKLLKDAAADLVSNTLKIRIE
jgi:hypothetical protein